jgi:thiosulfate reductase cytochrome b subunit
MHVRVPAAASVLLAIVLGTAGRAFVSSQLDVRCRDGLGRGTYDCTTLHGWLTAGSAGQVLLAAAAIALLVVSARSAGQRRWVTAAAWVLIPLSLGWIVVTSVLGYRSF